MKRLTARTVTAKTIADGWHLDEHGLYLQVTGGGAGRSWVYRYVIDGRQRYMGLGPLADPEGRWGLTLAEAREKASDAHKLRLRGLDPLEERRRQEQARIAERARRITFKDCAEQYLSLHLESFKNARHRQPWTNTLRDYVLPRLGNMVVADITSADVLACVEPIWTTKWTTASRVRQRIEKILDYASARQYRTGDNPATAITASLPKANGKQQHHAALPYAALPAFMAELRQQDGVAARALEFLVLTAARTGEVVGATWDEIDLKAKTWTIPASRMKAGREHRAPLSERAVEILQRLDQRSERLFPLATADMHWQLKELRADATVHGMRSAFMDWAHEQTSFPKAVIDMALAHAVGDKVEVAYRRGDLFVKRAKLMHSWAEYCGKTPISPAVIPLRANA